MSRRKDGAPDNCCPGQLEFEAGVVDGETDVAVRFGEAADGFHLVDVGFEHDYCYGDALAGGLDGADRGVAVDVADLHEDADAALNELRVLHVHVDHEVVVDIAETGHGAGGDHVEDHLLGACGLHAGGAGDDLGADLADDGGVGNIRERRVVIAGDGGSFGSAGAGVFDGSDDIGRAPAGGDADNDVFSRRTTACDVALADLGRVLVDVRCGGEGLGAAGHNVLDLRGCGGVSWWALRRVEGGDAAAGTGTDVDQPAAVTERTGDGIDDDGDLGQRFFDGCRYLGVFVVNDACDFES